MRENELKIFPSRKLRQNRNVCLLATKASSKGNQKNNTENKNNVKINIWQDILG